MKKVDVCISPALYNLYAKDKTAVVMLDTIRASTTICFALNNDAEFVLPVADIKEARSYKDRGYVIAGEREGEKIKGFDYGNSPFNFTEENIKGKKLAYTTTNGTQVIDLVKKGRNKKVDLLIGSFINVSALVNKLISLQKDILIICSGWKGTPNIEDTLLAGRIVEKLMKGGDFEYTEGANLAFNFYKSSSNNYYAFVMDNSPRLFAKNDTLENDFKYCLTEDMTDVVPYLNENILVV